MVITGASPLCVFVSKLLLLVDPVCLIIYIYINVNIFLFQAVLKWDDMQMTDLDVWLHLYGTEANPTNIMVTNLQWGKWGDDDKVICGPS